MLLNRSFEKNHRKYQVPIFWASDRRKKIRKPLYTLSFYFKVPAKRYAAARFKSLNRFFIFTYVLYFTTVLLFIKLFMVLYYGVLLTTLTPLTMLTLQYGHFYSKLLLLLIQYKHFLQLFGISKQWHLFGAKMYKQ